MTIILPTNEKNEKLQEDIDNNIRALWDKFKQQYNLSIDIINDKDALKEDLKNKNLIAYGTVEGNLFLNRYKSSYPFQIEKDKLVVDKEYVGTDFRLITAIPSPVNQDNAMLVFTAQKQEGMQGINNLIRNDSIDYFIADGKVEVKSGFYKKDKGRWGF
jgi:hypothetical protein